MCENPPLETVPSAISFALLRRRNTLALVLHTVQGGLMLFASQTVSGVKDFRRPVTVAFLEYDPVQQATSRSPRGRRASC